MDKKGKVPSSKIPVIGGQDTKIKEAMNQMLSYLDPIFTNFANDIESLGKRQAITEEIVSGALVDILTERIKERLDLKNPHFESIRIGSKKELPKRAKEEKELCSDGTEPVDTPLKEEKAVTPKHKDVKEVKK